MVKNQAASAVNWRKILKKYLADSTAAAVSRGGVDPGTVALPLLRTALNGDSPLIAALPELNLVDRAVAEIEALPDMIRKVLEQAPEIERIAKRYAHCNDFFFIGRGPLYPAALEGALKLKEISYIHAEGYHAAELKHGPIALLDPAHPVVALANNIPGRDKMLGNIQECRARKAPVIALVTEGDAEAEALAGDVIRIPECSRYAAALPTVAALQLLAYYIAAERGCEIDQPRNLAKSVTVE